MHPGCTASENQYNGSLMQELRSSKGGPPAVADELNKGGFVPADVDGIAPKSVASGGQARENDGVACLRLGRTHWQVRQDFHDLVLGPHAPNWFRLSRDTRAIQLKSGHRRRIWQVHLDSCSVHAKVSRPPRHSLRDRLRSVLRITAAEREWRIGRRAAARGAPVPQIVALGVRRGRKPGAVLISVSIPAGLTLAAAWTRSRKMPERDRVAEQRRLTALVAKLYAQAHRTGLVHRDNHPQNIVLAGGQEVIHGVLVDLASASLRRRPATHRERLVNLAQLEHHFHRFATRTQRLRFLRSYLNHTAGPGHETKVSADLTNESQSQPGSTLAMRAARAARRKWVRQILAIREHHALALARVRDRRIRTNNAYFATLHLDGGWKASVVLKLERRHVFPEPTVADRTGDEWRAVLAELCRALEIEGAGPTASAAGVRAFRWKGGGSMTSAILRGQARSAKSIFLRAHQLRHRDIAAPLVLGCLSRRGVKAGSWLLLPDA